MDYQSKKKIYFIYFDTNIIKSLEDFLGVIIDGVSETVKQEIKKKREGRFLGAL